MRLRSPRKIEALVLAAYPNAAPFREAGYDEAYQEYRVAIKRWENYRDSICKATQSSAPCICSTDSRLVRNPLRDAAETAVQKVNKLDHAAYDKLSAARQALSAVYHRVNELKKKS